MNLWPDAGYLVLAFLSGSVPWSWIVGRCMGRDIRKRGSGNAGATNLARSCGKPAGIAGLVLDAAKGSFAVLLVGTSVLGSVPDSVLVSSLAAILAVLGHVFSPWLGFRGGKGVATTLGAVVVLAPAALGIALAVFLLAILIWRYVSLASITGAAALVPSVLLLNRGKLPVQLVVILVAILIILRHISNVKRLLKGEEKRFWGKGSREGG